MVKKDNRPFPGRALSEDAIVTVVFEVKAYVSGTRAQLAALHTLSSAELLKLYEHCDKNGPQVIQAFGEMRALRAEEAMAVIPRKKHMAGPDGDQICSTPHVSTKHLVEDPDEVTCRLCLAKLDAEEKNG